MKQFLKYISLNYLPVPVIAISIVISSLFFKTKLSDRNITIAYADEVNGYGWVSELKNVKGFIFGSSSLHYGLSSNEMASNDSVWINFSMDARDPIVFYRLLEKYYPLIKPNTILVGLDPWIYSKRYYQYRNKVMYLDLNGGEIIHFLQFDKFTPVQRIKEYLSLKYKKHKISNELYNFSVPADLGSISLNKAAINFNEINEDWFELNKFGWSDIQYEYLKKINLFCISNKIRVIYLIPPKRKDYTALSEDKFSVEHIQWWQKIASAINGAEILGTYDVLNQYNQDSIFAEAYHLNKNGQRLFSDFVKSNLGHTQIVNASYNMFYNKVNKTVKNQEVLKTYSSRISF